MRPRSRRTRTQTKTLWDNTPDTPVGVPSRKPDKERGEKWFVTSQKAVDTQRSEKNKSDSVTNKSRKNIKSWIFTALRMKKNYK